MARRGPPPLPSKVKRDRGTLKTSRTNKREPVPDLGDPGMPPNVAANAHARECWRRLVPQLTRMRILGKSDQVALAGLCIRYAHAIEADAAIEKHGMVVKDRWKVLKPNPAVRISAAAWNDVRKFAAEFGLTPSARGRVSEHNEDDETPKKSDAESSDDFLFRRREARIAGSISPRG